MRISGFLVWASIFILAAFLFAGHLYAGIGSGTTSPNPTGGFGSTTTTTTTTNPNPTGGFGTTTGPSGGVTPLGIPPPPPDPTPLDGGTSILLISALGLGARKLYKELKNL